MFTAVGEILLPLRSLKLSLVYVPAALTLKKLFTSILNVIYQGESVNRSQMEVKQL
jgi:hypothetical protein